MTFYAFVGAIETALLFGLVAWAVLLSFRIVNFPDLTIDGSFPLGAAVAGVLIIQKVDPFAATVIAMAAGGVAGAMTGWLATRLGILHLLASILVMIALYSINLRIIGGPNLALIGEKTIFTPLEGLGTGQYLYVLVFSGVIFVTGVLLLRFLASEVGLSMRAAGVNSRMAAANGINVNAMTILALVISNALVALSGALYAQSQGAADVSMGIGMIVIGLASLIVGESFLSSRTLLLMMVAPIVGSVVYRLAVSAALSADFVGLKPQDLNLITAILVTFALILPRLRRTLGAARREAGRNTSLLRRVAK